MGEYQAVLDKYRARAVAFEKDTSGWKESSKSTDEIRIESKMSDKLNCSVYRMTFSVKVAPQVAIDTFALIPGTKRIGWDPDLNDITVIKQLNETTVLSLMRSNGIAKGVISPRELIDVLAIEKDGNNRWVVGGSVEDYPAIPSKDKFVRGVTGCMSMRVEEDPARPGYSKITFVQEVDMKGRLPRSIIDSTLPGVAIGGFQNWKKYLRQEGLMA
ncbi:stAR-related lipid transfer protein 6 [Aplysia californica]|uniref:StAR-related lipid transfer protein 6 n=1 Tax=Aplysia californica TaxID=6500 RepID=A0ABM1A3R2_APLCA|nr:stAR-related lipid transfer protein 6 [Aplysia californica]